MSFASLDFTYINTNTNCFGYNLFTSRLIFNTAVKCELVLKQSYTILRHHLGESGNTQNKNIECSRFRAESADISITRQTCNVSATGF
jgi:hypothetical protein